MPTGNEVEVTFCFTDGTKLTRIENIADITTFLEQHEEYVKVVRCKDCIHLHDHDCPIDWGKTDDDYCSFGEREDEVKE